MNHEKITGTALQSSAAVFVFVSFSLGDKLAISGKHGWQ